MISQTRLKQLSKLIQEGHEAAFYHWTEWEKLRLEVFRMDHYECQKCRSRGRYARAKVVHHVKHLRDRPDLALSIWDGETRQLVSLCKSCHEEEHPEAQRQYIPKAPPLTQERWD
jgi:5-methylcytosine-specific restriction endonuclease McrA